MITAQMLEKAMADEDVNKVAELLGQMPAAIENCKAQGIPLSFVAAGTGNLNLIKYVVEYSRASMNTFCPRHRTILHYAAASGNVASVRYLTEKVGMDPLAGDMDLITPYDVAITGDHKDIRAYFETIIGAKLEDMYRNPIRRGMFPDPSIVRVGEDYYMVNSSFIYFPCIPISHSKDLIHWRIIGHAITDPSWADLDHLEGGRGYWAPDISYHKDRFYITATYRMNDTGPVYRRQIVVSSDRPEGPYSQPAIIHEDGIDPSLFTDEDGRRYMLLNRGARILEVNETATEQVSEAELLYYGSQKRAPEGPHLLKKDGWYYLFLAEGGTGPGHRVTVARSRTLKGNYQPCPYNPIMRQEDPGAGIQRCGHGKPVMTQSGEWYMVYLCGRKIGGDYSMLGRETALDPITWTADGWPIVNGLKGPSVLQKKPNLPDHNWSDEIETPFGDKTLSKEWMFPRAPEKDGWLLEEGHLILKGSRAPLSSAEARNILLRRQRDFCFSAYTALEISALKDGQQAGMTCYYDENTWLSFSVHSEGAARYLRITEHIGDHTEIAGECAISQELSKIHLKIRTDYLRRSFHYSCDGNEYNKVSELDNVYYLSDEGLKKGKRFTGAMIGIFALGSDCFVPFTDFRMIQGSMGEDHVQ